MFKIICAALVAFILPFHVAAQVLPKEGSMLHYRIIGFSVPKNAGSSSYRLEVARGNYNSEDSFSKHIVVTSENKENRIVAEVPAFGEKYTWRMSSVKNKKGAFHHFSTLTKNEVDTTQTRLRITKSAEQYKDAYVFLNANNTLYDMEGHPVWYLPQTEKLHFNEGTIRDIKPTSRGTITFVVAGNEAYEVNYNGDVIWKAPNTGAVSGDTTERYNHEFVRLSNGHYMVSGMMWFDPVPKPTKNGPPPPPMPRMNPGQPGPGGPGPGGPNGPRHMNQKQAYGTLIEYDEKGNVVWSWKSDTYFRSSDITYFPNSLRMPMNDVHQNAFYFDEKNKVIYVSYKHIHRVLKVKYPEGTVIRSYGEKYAPGKTESGTGQYCFQHAVKLSQEGYMYLYNNNSCHSEQTPQILMMKEPETDGDDPAIVWEYDFPVNTLAAQYDNKRTSTGDETVGGNVIELPDRSLFASMCSPYSNLYIVDRNKKILWSAMVDKWETNENKWIMQFQYRASIITSHKDLEKMIWYSETKTK